MKAAGASVDLVILSERTSDTSSEHISYHLCSNNCSCPHLIMNALFSESQWVERQIHQMIQAVKLQLLRLGIVQNEREPCSFLATFGTRKGAYSSATDNHI